MVTIKVDVDGILRDFVYSFNKVYLQYYPEHKDLIKPVVQYGMELSYPIGKEVSNFMYKEHLYEIFYDTSPMEGALEFFNKLKQLGNVHIVTSQPIGAEQMTLGWLQYNNFNYDAITFTKEKYQINGICLIDDSTKHLIEEAKAGTSIPIALSQPWNQDWDGYKFNNYNQIVAFVEGLIK